MPFLFEHQQLWQIKINELGDLPFCIYPDEPQLLPASLHNILNTQSELAAHDNCMRFPRKLVEKVEAHTINLVVDVKAKWSQWNSARVETVIRLPFNIFSMILHNNIDEIVHRCILISD
jgi:hypothetical protein